MDLLIPEGSKVLHACRSIILEFLSDIIWVPTSVHAGTNPLHNLHLVNWFTDFQLWRTVSWVHRRYTTVCEVDELSQSITWLTGGMLCDTTVLVMVKIFTAQSGQIWLAFFGTKHGLMKANLSPTVILTGCSVNVSEKLKIKFGK